MVARDASYTTQPLELLNALSFENPKKNLVLTGDIEADASDSPRDRNTDDVKDNGKVSAQSSPRIGTHGTSLESGAHPKSDGSEGCCPLTFVELWIYSK